METTLETQAERDNRRTSAIVTFVMTLLLLFMLLYPFFSLEKDEDAISGIQVSLGTYNAESSGPESGAAPATSEAESKENTNDSAEASEASSESKPIAASEPSASTKKDVATSDEKESINLNKDKEDKSKSDEKKKADDKKKADEKAKKAAEEAKQKEIEAAKKAAEEEKRRKEKELADKKKSLSDFLGGGNGDDSDTNGAEDGAPDKTNTEGLSTGIGDIGGGLSGRDVVSRPNITDNSQATGKVVVKVCVNNEGKVISAKFTQKGTTATDLGLIKTAEQGVKKYVFSPGELDKQCGTITVNFKLQ